MKTYVVNGVKNFLIMLNNLLKMHLKLLQKEQLKKTAEGTVDLIRNIKSLIKLKQTHQRLIQRQIHKPKKTQLKYQKIYISSEKRQQIIDDLSLLE